jgi:hypothetical protein
MKKLAIFLIILFSAAAFAQPQIAVCVTGSVPNEEKDALGTSMLASLVNSGRYIGIESQNSFLAEITRQSAAIDDRRISELGRQFGVRFVCITDIAPVSDVFQVSARIEDVETAAVVFIGKSSFGQLNSMADLAIVSDNVVENMFGAQTTAAPEPILVPVPEQARQAAPSAADEKVTFDDVFFPSKKGTTVTYEHFNKLTGVMKKAGSSRISVKSVTGTADHGTIVYTNSLSGGKKYAANVVGGVLNLPTVMGGGLMRVVVTKDTYTLLPSKMTPGDTLPNAEASYTVGKFYVTATITDRKCTGIEMVTVPAGTFECYKVEQKTTIVLNLTIVANSTIWYARGIGEVKSVNHEPNGNQQGYSELKKLVRK